MCGPIGGAKMRAMEPRLLRYFVAVAEELHMARAADRLGVEQSPVSRAMRDLEELLGVSLFDRSNQRTRLTWAGEVFLGECRHVLAAVAQAAHVAKAAAQGYQGFLRLAVSDGLALPRIASLLAISREDEPEVEIRVFEMPFARQLESLREGMVDIGFALSNAVTDDAIAEPVWNDRWFVVLPVRHPLLAYVEVPLDQVLRYQLVLYQPDAGEGGHPALRALLESSDASPKVVEQTGSLGVMLTLVGAGYGIGFAPALQLQTLLRPDIAIRPLAGPPCLLSTYLLRRQGESSPLLQRFLQRLQYEAARIKDCPPVYARGGFLPSRVSA